MSRPILLLPPVLCAMLATAGMAMARELPDEEAPLVLPVPMHENVRIEFARVLAAEPVYQTLRSTGMVERCEAASPVNEQSGRRGLSRVMGAVRDALGSEEEDGEAAAAMTDECRMVPVEQEFRRPIGYDVDYMHRGVKYRTRMPYDPGNRVRVRVSVTPVIAPGD